MAHVALHFLPIMSKCARKMGAGVVKGAESIPASTDNLAAVCLLGLGIHFLLGFYFSGPQVSLLALFEVCIIASIVYIAGQQNVEHVTQDLESKAAAKAQALQDRIEELQHTADDLQDGLQEVQSLYKFFPHGSPAGLMVEAIDSILAGKVPDETDLLFLRSSIIVSSSHIWGVYQPAAGLEKLHNSMEPDVEQALMQSLLGLGYPSAEGQHAPAQPPSLHILHEVTPDFAPCDPSDCNGWDRGQGSNEELCNRICPPPLSSMLAALACDVSTLDVFHSETSSSKASAALQLQFLQPFQRRLSISKSTGSLALNSGLSNVIKPGHCRSSTNLCRLASSEVQEAPLNLGRHTRLSGAEEGAQGIGKQGNAVATSSCGRSRPVSEAVPSVPAAPLPAGSPESQQDGVKARHRPSMQVPSQHSSPLPSPDAGSAAAKSRTEVQGGMMLDCMNRGSRPLPRSLPAATPDRLPKTSAEHVSNFTPAPTYLPLSTSSSMPAPTPQSPEDSPPLLPPRTSTQSLSVQDDVEDNGVAKQHFHRLHSFTFGHGPRISESCSQDGAKPHKERKLPSALLSGLAEAHNFVKGLFEPRTFIHNDVTKKGMGQSNGANPANNKHSTDLNHPDDKQNSDSPSNHKQSTNPSPFEHQSTDVDPLNYKQQAGLDPSDCKPTGTRKDSACSTITVSSIVGSSLYCQSSLQSSAAKASTELSALLDLAAFQGRHTSSSELSAILAGVAASKQRSISSVDLGAMLDPAVVKGEPEHGAQQQAQSSENRQPALPLEAALTWPLASLRSVAAAHEASTHKASEERRHATRLKGVGSALSSALPSNSCKAASEGGPRRASLAAERARRLSLNFPHAEAGQPQQLMLAGLKLSIPSPQAAPVAEIEALLDAAFSSFSCDMFKISAATRGHPLSTLSYYLLHRCGFMSSLGLDPIKTARFLRRIEAGYEKTIPYHNATHAADVLQTLHVILCNGIALEIADPQLHFAAYLAAILHDFEHGGFTNDFLIKSGHDLAISYNDRSVMENHHLAAGFRVLRDTEYNFLSHLSEADFNRIRRVVIDLVLATDMKQHLSLLGQFNTVLQQAKVGPHCPSSPRPRFCSSTQRTVTQLSMDAATLRDGGNEVSGDSRMPPQSVNRDVSMSRLSAPISSEDIFKDRLEQPKVLTRSSPSVPDASLQTPWTPMEHSPSSGLDITSLDSAQKMLLLQIALKCADLGHLAEGRDVHIRWVQCLEEEFYRQGDVEKEMHLLVSPLFDRAKVGVTRSQVGFFDVVALPLFQALVAGMPSAQPLLSGCEQNYMYWKQVGQQRQGTEAIY